MEGHACGVIRTLAVTHLPISPFLPLLWNPDLELVIMVAMARGSLILNDSSITADRVGDLLDHHTSRFKTVKDPLDVTIQAGTFPPSEITDPPFQRLGYS